MRSIAAVYFLVVFAVTASANPVTNAYSGGDPGEGLDLEGNFVYAIDVGDTDPGGVSGGQTVGDATFTDWEATPGATVVAQNNETALVDFGGGSLDDDNLQALVSTGRWANDAPPDITADLEVTAGTAYRLQLLVMEGWNSTAPGIRQFNISVEGNQIYTDFDTNAITGPQGLVDGAGPPNTLGAVLTYNLVAGDDTLNVVLSHGSVDNPNLSGLTLEVVPEPGTLLIAAIASVLGCFVIRRRRRMD